MILHMKTAGGWVLDIVVGWIAGSIVGALIAEVAFSRTESNVMWGVLLGTVGGIMLMRHWRKQRASG